MGSFSTSITSWGWDH